MLIKRKINNIWQNKPWMIRENFLSMGSQFQLFTDWFEEEECDESSLMGEVYKDIGIIKMHGVIEKEISMLGFLFGSCSLTTACQLFDSYILNSEIKTIILDIASPGGSIDGVQEFANKVFESRQKKKIIGYVNNSACSAAYWIGSACNNVILSSKCSEVGSIGVVAYHVDTSELEKQIGVKTTEIFSGKYKRIASEYSPLSKEGHAYLQEQVDYLYTVFAEDVAKFRKIKVQEILAQESKIYFGFNAIKAGLVDYIQSYLVETYKNVDIINKDSFSHFASDNINKNSNVSNLNSSVSRLDERCQGMPDELEQLREENRKLKEELDKLKNKQETPTNTPPDNTQPTSSTKKVQDEIQKAISKGVEQENKRILAIDELYDPKYESILIEAKKDINITASDVAFQILKLEKETRHQALETFKKDSSPKVLVGVESESNEVEKKMLRDALIKGASSKVSNK